MIPAPEGRWWLAYDDGTVWPCEVEGPGIASHWFVIPQDPAPDAGTRRLEPRGRIYDAAFNHPAIR